MLLSKRILSKTSDAQPDSQQCSESRKLVWLSEAKYVSKLFCVCLLVGFGEWSTLTSFASSPLFGILSPGAAQVRVHPGPGNAPIPGVLWPRVPDVAQEQGVTGAWINPTSY